VQPSPLRAPTSAQLAAAVRKSPGPSCATRDERGEREQEVVKLIQPGFRSCDRQKARGAILPHQSRWVCASDQTSINSAWRRHWAS